jgi:polysaccharide transporter, PST family
MIQKFKLFKDNLLLLRNSDNVRKIFNNISWLFFDQVLRFVMNIVVGILLARCLGPIKLGVYSYIFAFTAIFAAVSGLGIRAIVVRDLLKTPDRKNEILGTSFFLLIGSGILSWLLSLLIFYIIRPYDKSSFFLISLIGPSFILQSFQVISYYFESQTQSKNAVFATSLGLLIGNCIKITVLLTEPKLIFFILITLLELFITGCLLTYIYTKKNNKLTAWRFNFEVAKSLLRDSFPLFLSTITIIIYMKIDQIMIRDLSSDAEAGIYSVAIKLTEIWYFIPLIVQSSVMPNIMGSLSNLDEFYAKMQGLFTVMVGFSYVVIIGNMLFSQWAVNTLFGPAYASAPPILNVSIWALLFICLGIMRNIYLLGKNLVMHSFIFTFIGMSVNIVLNFILIPKYGAIGAAWATLVTQFLSAYLLGFLFKPTRKISKIMTKSLLLRFH